MSEATPTLNSTGFALTNASSQVNADGAKYLYVAIAEPTTRSMTQAEFDAQKLRHVTYENRRCTHEGEQAQAKRDELISELQAEGIQPRRLRKSWGLFKGVAIAGATHSIGVPRLRGVVGDQPRKMTQDSDKAQEHQEVQPKHGHEDKR